VKKSQTLSRKLISIPTAFFEYTQQSNHQNTFATNHHDTIKRHFSTAYFLSSTQKLLPTRAISLLANLQKIGFGW
jgi:hypothetical protein